MCKTSNLKIWQTKYLDYFYLSIYYPKKYLTYKYLQHQRILEHYLCSGPQKENRSSLFISWFLFIISIVIIILKDVSFSFQDYLTLLSNFLLIFSGIKIISWLISLELIRCFVFLLMTGHSNRCCCVSINSTHNIHHMLLVSEYLKFSLILISMVLTLNKF